MNSVRREQICEYVKKNHVATIEQLKTLLPDVSLMTIHRDLNFLQEQGLLLKIRGGARYAAGRANEPAFSAREIVNRSQKQRLSEKAVALLGGVNSAFVDSGTTTAAFARILPDTAMHIVTTGPNIAIELAKKQRIEVDVCGGALNRLNLTISGAPAIEMLSRVNIDTAFLVASGYTGHDGFTCGKESEARIKSLVIEKARCVVMMMDTSKLGNLLPYTFGQLKDVDYLVTESAPQDLPPDLTAQAKLCDVTIV